MQTSTQDPLPPAEWFNPLAGWEAASRWNRATFDWMATGWQQWLALVTTVPTHLVVLPAASATDAPASGTRKTESIIPVRAMAKAETKRPQRVPAKSRKTAAKTRSRRS
jgi:hypothetical protein